MRFLFYVPVSSEARGGISVIFDMIEVLNAQGIDAVALYDRPDFEYDRHTIRAPRVWSPKVQDTTDKKDVKSILKAGEMYLTGRNRRPVTNAKTCPEWMVRNGDLLVVPEYVSDWLPNRLPANIPLVLLNQNPFAFFRASQRVGFNKSRFSDSISVSEACAKSTRIVLGRETERISVQVSEELFSYQDNKKLQFAYMPRKRGNESLFLVNSLKESDIFTGFSFTPIDGVSGVEAAKIIRESLFFLSFSEKEGFGLPAAEAIATGAIVIGYSGVGGDEFFDDDTGFLVPEDNLMAFYDKVISVVCSYDRNKEIFDEKRRSASRKILETYSKRNFKIGVIEVFSRLSDRYYGKFS